MSRARRVITRTVLALVLAVTATAAGYWVSSQLGPGLLRTEAESQLAGLLRGDVSIGSLHLGELGLRLEGRDVRVYPEPGGHGLVARQVVAKIDPLSLLVGRFHLRSLLIVDARFAIARSAEGAFSPYPIASLDRDEPPGSPDPERRLGLLNAFEAATRFLLEEGRIADLLVVRNGVVSFVDRASPDGGDPPVELSLVGIQGTLDHRWLSDAPELELDAIFADREGERARIEVEGRQDHDSLRITVAATGLEMAAFQPYARALGPEAQLEATLSGTFSFETGDPDTSVSEIDWVARDLVCALPRRGAQVRFESASARMEARLEAHPGRVRLASARVRGREVAMDASAHIERPLRESSEARLALSLRGVELPALRRFASSLPASDRGPLLKLMEPVESARIVEVHGSGSTRIAEWRRLFAGELDDLPPGFVVGSEVDDVTVTLGERENRATGIAGTVDWSGGGVEVRGLTGRWNGEPMPEIDAVVEGFPRLFAGEDGDRELDRAPRLPGLSALERIVREIAGGRDREEPSAPMPPVEVAIESLRHPLLRWPVREARLSIEATERSTELRIHAGRWSGAPIRGELVWLREPEPHVHLGLEVLPERESESAPDALAEPAGPDVAAVASPAPAPVQATPDTAEPAQEPWVQGAVRVGAVPTGPLAFRTLEGRFSGVGGKLVFTGVELTLEPRGVLRGDVSLDLESEGRVGTAAAFQLREGDVSRLSGLFGIPDDLATGTVTVKGSLEGPVRPATSPLAGLKGFVSLRAEDGELRQRIPLVVALATATEGFNPFASREAIRYESIDTTLELDEGVLRSDAFTLEGPVRVFASGALATGDPTRIDAVVGVFLFRQADRMLGRLPLVKDLISDKGLVGAYFEVEGPVDDPAVRTLPGKTLAESMPNVVKAPFKVLEFLLSPPGRTDDNGDDGAGDDPEQREKMRPGPGRLR